MILFAFILLGALKINSGTLQNNNNCALNCQTWQFVVFTHSLAPLYILSLSNSNPILIGNNSLMEWADSLMEWHLVWIPAEKGNIPSVKIRDNISCDKFIIRKANKNLLYGQQQTTASSVLEFSSVLCCPRVQFVPSTFHQLPSLDEILQNN